MKYMYTRGCYLHTDAHQRIRLPRGLLFGRTTPSRPADIFPIVFQYITRNISVFADLGCSAYTEYIFFLFILFLFDCFTVESPGSRDFSPRMDSRPVRICFILAEDRPSLFFLSRIFRSERFSYILLLFRYYGIVYFSRRRCRLTRSLP